MGSMHPERRSLLPPNASRTAIQACSKRRWSLLLVVPCVVLFTATSTGAAASTSAATSARGVAGALEGEASAKDVTPPTTRVDPQRSVFIGPASIPMHASDKGSGVAATYYSVNGGKAVRGGSIYVRAVGTFSVTFWSVDKAGNVEVVDEVHNQVGFKVIPMSLKPISTSTSIKSNVGSARRSAAFYLSGTVTNGQFRDPCEVFVKPPGSSRWSYSSARGVDRTLGWWYRYGAKKTGTYHFYAKYPYAIPRWADQGPRLPSTSRAISVEVR